MTEIKQTLKTPSGAQNILDKLTDKDKKISELETKLNQPLTNQELLFQLVKKLESGEFKLLRPLDGDRGIYLVDNSNDTTVMIGWIMRGENRLEPFKKEWNDKFQENYLKEQKDKQKPVILFDEYERKNSSKLTKIQGILTSNIRSRTSSDIPYMAFVRTDKNKKHSLAECERIKCQECEIPVVFRITNNGHDNHLPGNFTCVIKHREFGEAHWIKPNLSKGDSVILEGEFSPSEKSNRPSFTCYSYQIINDHE